MKIDYKKYPFLKDAPKYDDAKYYHISESICSYVLEHRYQFLELLNNLKDEVFHVYVNAQGVVRLVNVDANHGGTMQINITTCTKDLEIKQCRYYRSWDKSYGVKNFGDFVQIFAMNYEYRGKYKDGFGDYSRNREHQEFCQFVATEIATYNCALLSFILFAEIETKELAPKEKKKIQKQKYKNDLDSTVTLIDTRWNTNIFTSGPFGVRGHWRKQPYKDGIKLKWINPFVKKGYKSKARKLTSHA